MSSENITENKDINSAEIEYKETVNDPEKDRSSRLPEKTGKKVKSGNKRKKPKIWLYILILLLIAASVGFFMIRKRKNAAMPDFSVSDKNVSQVMRGDVVKELSSSGSLSPKDTYTITSLVSGEILSADFEKGEEVKEGQVLYVIDDSDSGNEVSSAERQLEFAKKDLDDANEDLEEIKKKLGSGTVCSEMKGYVSDITLKAGDNVPQGGFDIAEILDDSVLSARIPFLENDVDVLRVGQELMLVIQDTGEETAGKIKSISSASSVSGGVKVKYINVEVENPGGLKTTDYVSAYTEAVSSLESALLEPHYQGKLRVELPAPVKVASVLLTEGQYIKAGTPLFTVTKDSLEDSIESFERKLSQAEDSLMSAEERKDKLQEEKERYTITAPISGQVIQKYAKAGDNISTSQNNGQMALIYDLSELTFEMSIDELDIVNVIAGQEVRITADAFEGQVFTGHVTSVGLNGNMQNGITTYPVVVTLDEKGDLLPGMNVDGTIILQKAENTLYIPVNALQRGNIVYVKNDGLTERGLSPDSEDLAGMPEEAEEGSDGNRLNGRNRGARGQRGMGNPLMGAFSANNSQDDTASESIGGAPEGFTAVKVETGIISDESVEILSGLSEGQEVYVKDDATSFGMWGMMGMRGGPGGGPGGF